MSQFSGEAILDKLGISYSDRGNRLSFLCPIHYDTSPSAAFYQDTERFYCFSCEYYLTITGFYKKVTDATYEEAKRQLELEFGELPKPRQIDRFLISMTYEKAEACLPPLRGIIPRERFARLGDEVDLMTFAYKKRKLDEKGLDKALNLWYTRVHEEEENVRNS